MSQKRFAVLLIILVCALFLTACGGGSTAPAAPPTATPALAPAPVTTPAVEKADTSPGEGRPARGIWEGDTYTSAYLGLQFALPRGWSAATDAEIANIVGIASDIFESDIWENVDVTMMIDMLAMNPQTGANINILFERLGFPNRGMTAPEYIAAQAELMGQMGMNVTHIFPDPTQIGALEWFSYSYESGVWDRTTFGRGFVHIGDGFATVITITYFEDSESVEEILAMFQVL